MPRSASRTAFAPLFAVVMSIASACSLLHPQSSTSEYLDVGDGVGIEMVWIPGGTFIMGSPPSEEKRGDDEGPRAEVRIEAFWMGKYEVTQEQYEKVMGNNPSHFEGRENPVENVTWNDAMAFCKRVSQRTGKHVILPTEAQWEYACRAGSIHRFGFGDSEKDLENYGWFILNSGRRSRPVGQKRPNAWGLFDMHGNASEWCLSKYRDYPYIDDDGRNRVDESGENRVLRGGCWSYLPWKCRCSSRHWLQPDLSNRYRGFRIVRVGN